MRSSLQWITLFFGSALPLPTHRKARCMNRNAWNTWFAVLLILVLGYALLLVVAGAGAHRCSTSRAPLRSASR